MYIAILTAAGYTLHSKHVGSECWIKEGKPDINYDPATGLWASEFADNAGQEYGTDAASLETYLTAV